MVLLTLASFYVPTIQSVKESYETTLLRRQKDREEQAKMEKEMEQKQELEKKNEQEKRRVETDRSGSSHIAIRQRQPVPSTKYTSSSRRQKQRNHPDISKECWLLPLRESYEGFHLR